MSPTSTVDELKHFGVKGMKWGVRKERYNAIRNGPRQQLTLTAKNGDKVDVIEDPYGVPLAVMAMISSRSFERTKETKHLSINVNGERVGNASLWPKGDAMYLNWLGIDKQHRGKGYASTVFDAGVAYSRSQGKSKIILEVPGKSPDARHIYEKRGFVAKGTLGSPNDIWGGLTIMELDIKER